MGKWYVVVASHRIQAVYGGALLVEANSLAEALTVQFPFAASRVYEVNGSRPSIGQPPPKDATDVSVNHVCRSCA